MSDSILHKDQIREICLAHGYTVKSGNEDLKDYVYECAHAIAQAAIAEYIKTPPKETNDENCMTLVNTTSTQRYGLLPDAPKVTNATLKKYETDNR